MEPKSVCTPVSTPPNPRSRLSLLAQRLRLRGLWWRRRTGRRRPAASPPCRWRSPRSWPMEQTDGASWGIVKSRRSTTAQPSSPTILVRSGDRVAPGATLHGDGHAASRGGEPRVSTRGPPHGSAPSQAIRMKTLPGGAASQAELEQAQTALATNEAQLQVREQHVALAYHRVSSPSPASSATSPCASATVTRSTVPRPSTRTGLEVYINVPVGGEAEGGLPVGRERGQLLADETLSFVSLSVDPATQSVLAKTLLSSRRRPHRAARRSSGTTLTAPLLALDHINRQFFAYLVEKGEGGALVARQRAVELGQMVGNDYVVTSGLKPDETLSLRGAEGPRRRTRRDRNTRGWREREAGSRAFRHVHPPPDPRPRSAGRGDLHSPAPHRAARAHAAGRQRAVLLHRRRRSGGRERGDDAARAANEQHRRDDVHPVIEQRHGLGAINVSFEVGRDPDLAAVDVNRVNQTLGLLHRGPRRRDQRRQEHRRFMGTSLFSKDNRYSAQFISNYVDLYISMTRSTR